MKKERQRSEGLKNSRSSASLEFSYLQDLAENINDGILMFDVDKKVVAINSIMRKVAGVNKETSDLEDILDRLKDKVKVEEKEDRKIISSLSKIVNKVIKTDQTFHIPECLSGNKVFELFVKPTRHQQSRKTGGVIVMRDITRLKEIKEMKTEFISIASHQLRTPLTSIKLFMEMLANERDGELNEKQREYVSDVRKSTERMIALVNNLLNVSRLEEGELKIDPKPDDLVYFIKDVIHGVMQLAHEKKIKINYQYPQEELTKVSIDRTLLHQVVHNLLTNAIKYSPAGKNAEIKVKLEKRVDDYLISIKDDGIGIFREEQKRIFEKFFRSENAVKAHAEGTGLGLYVAKIIIEASGADMWLKSKKGKGTTFYISIPHRGMSKKEGGKSLVN